jgi:RHS repeat-associated protein
MKHKMIKSTGLLLVFLSQALFAQLSPSENYTYTKTCLNEDCSRKTESVEYTDGFGRPKQSILIKGTPAGKDVVSYFKYDELGRQLKAYLPIPQQGTNNGGIYTDPLNNAPGIYGNEKIYSETIVEESPVGKPKQAYSVGNAWSSRPKKFTYDVNAAIHEEVKKYTVSASWINGVTNHSIVQSGIYPNGTLIKTSVTDEDGNTAIEFKNGLGQTILVRKELSSTQNADTYYVYNQYGQLAFVIPPHTVENVLTPENLGMLCYQYKYDSRGRQAEKKLPGKGWEYFVYDRLDRVIMSQDANMGASKMWMFSKYDRLGRVIYTGTYTGTFNYGSEGRQAEQSSVNANTVLYESETTGGFNATGVTAYYTNAVYPVSFTKILSINYYDAYPQGSPARPTQVLGQNTISNNTDASFNTKNLPTASYIKNIEDDNWTKSYSWYDEKLRAVSTYTLNHLGGYTRTESELDFAGMIKQSKVYHKRLNTDLEKVITQTFEYDEQNRLKKQTHQVDSNPVEILAQNEYNELSQVKNKKVGGTSAASPLQSIDYAYNIRGSLTKVNDPANLNGKLFGYEIKYTNSNNTPTKYDGSITETDWKTATDNVLRRYSYTYDGLGRLAKGAYSEPLSSVPQNDLFNETISYNLGGNITSMQRNGKSYSGTAQLIDNLTYDYTGNRLNSVTDSSTNYSGYPDVSGNTISYDDNGNMKDHTDKGVLQIDYNFYNLPAKITFNQTYRVRNLVTGSLTNRNVTTNYTFKADGTKLRKVYKYGGELFVGEVSISTDYLDGFQYESQTASSPFILKFVPTAEGYYNFENNKYIYSYTDHLGNVRLSYTQNGSGTEIIEENNFYPFGMKHEGYNALAGNPSYNYGYNGKELQKETGWSDYGWRQYMPDLGRWNSIDPLAEAYTNHSPYAYVMNNPVMFFDPNGMLSQGFMDQIMGSPSGTTWYNTGMGFTSDGGHSMDYDGNTVNWGNDYTTNLLAGIGINYSGGSSGGSLVGSEGGMETINIPEIVLTGSNSFWALQIRSHVNKYMEWWNAKSDFAWDRVRNAGRYNDGPIKMMGGAYDPLGIFEGIGMALSASDNSNYKLAALPLLIITRNGDDALKLLAVEKGILNTGPLKNISGSLNEASALAKSQPYGPNTNVFRRLPRNAQDAQALSEAQQGMGRNLNLRLGDPRYQGWEKWHHSVGPKGGKSVVHYLRDPKTGLLTDFKFK